MEELNKYAGELIDSIENAIDNFNNSIPKAQKEIYNEVLLILKDLEVKNGKILNNTKNLKLISKLNKAIEKVAINDDYVSKTKDFIREFSTATSIQTKYFQQIKKDFKPSERVKVIRELAIENTIDSLLDSGIDVNFTQPLKELIQQNITSGGSYSDLTKIVENYIIGNNNSDGRLERYTKQITTDALNQYSANYNHIASEDLNLEWFMYVGSNIKTTRDFCEHLTSKKYIHISELDEIIKGKIDGYQVPIYKKTGLPYGMVSGTTIYNFKVYRGGYNCGHQLYPIPASVVPLKIREKIKKVA